MASHVNKISRVQLVKYAGASGDFNPIHIDEEFAKNSPLKGLIAHGMLSMGFISQYLESVTGDPLKVTRVNVQFRNIVRPGDEVSCSHEVVSSDEKTSHVNIFVKNQREEIVLKGDATIIN